MVVLVAGGEEMVALVVAVVVGTGMIVTAWMGEDVAGAEAGDGLIIEEMLEIEVEAEATALVLRGSEPGVAGAGAGAGAEAGVEVTAGVAVGVEAGPAVTAQGVVARVAAAAAAAEVMKGIRGGPALVNLIRWRSMFQMQTFLLSRSRVSLLCHQVHKAMDVLELCLLGRFHLPLTLMLALLGLGDLILPILAVNLKS